MKVSTAHILLVVTIYRCIPRARSETIWCENKPCRRPMTESCSTFLEQNEILDVSTCCSLMDGIDGTGCFLIVSSGACAWEPRDYDHTVQNIPYPGVTMASGSRRPCPESRYWPDLIATPLPPASPEEYSITYESTDACPTGSVTALVKDDIGDPVVGLEIRILLMGSTDFATEGVVVTGTDGRAKFDFMASMPLVNEPLWCSITVDEPMTGLRQQAPCRVNVCANNIYHRPTSIGCYKDIFSNRDMPEQLEDNLSINDCITGCANLNYAYAGLQAGHLCFCGEDYGSYGPAANCDSKCVGGQGICGGNFANSIFETGISLTEISTEPEISMETTTEVLTTEELYIGCFRDGWLRAMDHQIDEGLSIDECISDCGKLQYSFAGLQAGRQCFCGTDYGLHGKSENCISPCDSGDGICGGHWANSVYATGISVEPTREDYIGCFADDRSRVMDEQLQDGLSIDQCISGCANFGFFFAGLQAGRHCFCGDEYGLLGESDDCLARCNNGSGICGGNFANSVYETGIVP